MKLIMQLTILLILLIMKTLAELADGNQNKLQYTKDVQNVMKKPKVYHLHWTGKRYAT